MKATGERFIPGAGMGTEIELEHMHRYLAVAPLVKNMKVLDAACGTGYGSALLAEYADKVTGIDIDSETIDYANKNYSRNNLSFAEMSIAALKFPDASFDAVISFETIEHVSEDLQTAFLQQVRRVLKPNGFLVISTPDLAVLMRRSHGTYCNPFHIKEYNFTEFHDFLAKYFPYVVMHKQGKVRCSVIDGAGTALLNEAPNDMEGEYIIAVCSMDNKDIHLGSAFQSTNIDGAILSTLYFNEGRGYSEENKRILPLYPDLNGLFHADITIPQDKKIRSIRFDPVEGNGCIISDFGALADGVACIFLILNAVDKGNYYLFANVDPQIEIMISANTQTLKLSGKISLLSASDTINEAVNIKNQQLTEQDSVIEQQQNQLAEQGSVIEQQQKQLTEQVSVSEQQQKQLTEQGSVIERQQKQLTEQGTVIGQQQKQLAEQGSVIEQQQKQLTEQGSVIEQQQKQLTEQGSVIEQQQKQLTEQGSVIEQQQKQLTEQGSVIEQQQNEITVIQSCYDTISNAFFWKISGPLRKILDALKKNHCVFLFLKGMRYVKSFGIKATWMKVQAYEKKNAAITHAINAEKKLAMNSNNDMRMLIKQCKLAGGGVFGEENILKNMSQDMVLLVSHELNLTGAPIALQYFAESLKRQGKTPIVIAPHDDRLRCVLADKGITVITHPALFHSSIVSDYASIFSFIVLNTNVCAPIVTQLNGRNIPVLWWIHEAQASYHSGALASMPESLCDNIHVYCGGKWAQSNLRQYRPKYATDILLYCVPDLERVPNESNFVLENAAGKTVFACVGMLEERKGQDILVKAISCLSEKEREKSLFVFVGREYYPPIINAIRSCCEQYPENVRYIPELSQSDLRALYARMDCLICSSKDDPLPVVVTDALALSKIVICSENTGSAALLQEMNSGLIYRNNDSKDLAAMVSLVLSDDPSLDITRLQARNTYEKHFIQSVFDRKIEHILYQMILPRQGLLRFIETFYKVVYDGLQEIRGEDLICKYANNGKKNVLIISHELSLTGGPIVLHHLGCVLREQGNNVIFISPFDGPLGREIESGGFPLILFDRVYDCDFLREVSTCFDLIFLNTVVTYRAVELLADTGVPVLWWIHDSKLSYKYFGNCMPKELPSNVKVICGGNYAKQQLMAHYPLYSAQELLYSIHDCAKVCNSGDVSSIFSNDKKVFLIVGTIEIRKGQDIVVQAIKLLSKNDFDQCIFLFMGKILDQQIATQIFDLCHQFPNNVRYVENVSHAELVDYYRNAECLICSSRDDPMPVVVTEMQSLSKPVICSENTGSASLIRELSGGIIYENNDPKALLRCIKYVIDASKGELQQVGLRARTIYERYFAEDVFNDKICQLVEQECSLARKSEITSVSIVIPTLNAKSVCRSLMEALRQQHGIGLLEIIIVDSGSTDGTQDICAEYGAKIIQITQTEFSHSYARNLGAQNATGTVLIFMTQDALPSSDHWIEEMIAPILTNESIAVSCREECPADTDLYYRIASWYHSHYVGTAYENRIETIQPRMSMDDLRKAASLSDVACAIKKDVFLNFGYRFGYAEDLDLGIRLLRSGNTITLLHRPTVIHGHSRQVSYYLRRSIVESRALKNILGSRDESMSAGEIADLLIPTCIALDKYLGKLESDASIYNVSDFTEAWNRTIKTITNDDPLEFDMPLRDETVNRCIELLHPYWSGSKRFGLLTALNSYYKDILCPCVLETQWIEKNVSGAICDCIRKQLAVYMGNWLGCLSENEEIFSQISELSKGV